VQTQPITFVAETRPAPVSRWRLFILLIAVLFIALAFVRDAALPYFALDHSQFRGYWPRRWWLLLHISTGMVALLSGPVQLWLGLTSARPELHRRIGITYVGSVAVSAVAGYYLAFNTTFGWVFGAGLAGLATAWLTTTGLALVAIRRHLIEQHKEWMIRSYVVTTAFITFRALSEVLKAAGVGTVSEQIAICSWFCWAVPLLVTEAILQGRKVLGVRPALR
jgi:hypothetical protein